MRTINLEKQEVTVKQSPVTYEELSLAMDEIKNVDSPINKRSSTPLPNERYMMTQPSECDDCEAGHECEDCKEKLETPLKSDIMNDGGTDYNFNLVVPSKNTAPVESEADKRRRMIYIGIGLITVFVFVFIALKATKKTA